MVIVVRLLRYSRCLKLKPVEDQILVGVVAGKSLNVTCHLAGVCVSVETLMF